MQCCACCASKVYGKGQVRLVKRRQSGGGGKEDRYGCIRRLRKDYRRKKNEAKPGVWRAKRDADACANNGCAGNIKKTR